MADKAFPSSTGIKLSVCDFDDMKLQIGERLELEFTGQAERKPHFSRLIGYLQGQGLIVQTPLENGLPILLREGDEILVRAFSGTQAFAFTSTVVRICVSPFFYLHLSFPDVVQGAVIRHTLRVRVDLAASVFEAGQAGYPLPAPATLVNLSVAGALLAAPPGLGKVGDSIRLRFSFPVTPDNRPVDMECGALIKSMKEERGRAQYGIAFTGLLWSESILLQILVYKTLLDNYRNVA